MDLSLLSRYRPQLMGIAAIMIIICHMPANGVAMPSSISSIIVYGGLGCDIFLFLSGMGLWYSLSKESSFNGQTIIRWLSKRYIRIFVPYLIIAAPSFLIKALLQGWSVETYFLRLSTLSYWTEGWGAWFVSLILILYLLAPFLFLILFGKKKWLILIILLLMTWLFGSIPELKGVLKHIQFAVCRIPSFLIGMASAEEIKKGSLIPLCKVLVPLLFLLTLGSLFNVLLNYRVSLFWIEGMLLLIITVIFIDTIKQKPHFMSYLSFFGMISLESYLTNVFVLSFFSLLPWQIGQININPGNWSYYIVGTFFCLILSFLVHRISDMIIQNRCH